MVNLLVACSKSKSKIKEPIPAKRRYTGTLFRSLITLAEDKGWTVHILSAEYGWITPATLLPEYDTVLAKPYDGLYPQGSGYYVKNDLYFPNPPEGYEPLFQEPLPIGELNKRIQSLLSDPNLRSGVGVTAEIYKKCMRKKYTKSELLEELSKEFPDRKPSQLKITIGCQLTQNRMGKERGCTVHSDEQGRYWLTRGQP